MTAGDKLCKLVDKSIEAALREHNEILLCNATVDDIKFELHRREKITTYCNESVEWYDGDIDELFEYIFTIHRNSLVDLLKLKTFLKVIDNKSLEEIEAILCVI